MGPDLKVLTDEDIVKLYKQTKVNKDKEAYRNEILRRHRAFLDYKANAYRSSAIPVDAIRGQVYQLCLQSMDSYTPGFSTKFKTFMESNLRGLSRYTNQNKSPKRIPEHIFLGISKYETAKNAMENLLGREASNAEIAEHLGWSVKRVEEVEGAKNTRHYSEEESMERKLVPGAVRGDLWKETKEFVYFSLDAMEQLVYDHSEGAHGKSLLKADAIAKKLNISVDKVYMIRKKIDKRISDYAI